MKKASIYVDARRKNANGEYPVYIRVFDDVSKRTVKFSVGLTSPVVFKVRAFPREVPNAEILTTRLNEIFGMVQKVILLNEDLSMDEFKREVEKMLGRKVHDRPKYFVDYVKMFMATKLKPKTISLYEQTVKKVMEYDAKATFDTITSDWLTGYEKHYLKTMTVNGLAISLRNIRAVFNWAIDNDYTTKYPFRKYKIKQEKTRKRCLTLDQLRLLRDYNVEDWQREYRDMFLLQIYLIGINISDLLQLKSLTDGRCVYHRNKTGRLYDIAVPTEAMAIINRYKGKNYLLCPLDRYKNVDDYTHHLNDALKKIGTCKIVRDKVGKLRKYSYKPLFPELTSYWSRHTWATIAASLDIPKETIGKALGHSEWDSTTTDIYIDFDMRKVDEANRRVIDYINKA